MIPDYFLLKLVEHAQIMRDVQKSFFKEKDLNKKREILSKAKQSEKEFDEVLNNVKQLLK